MEHYAAALGVEPRKPFEFEAGRGWYFSRQDVKNARVLVASAAEVPDESNESGGSF